MKNTYRVAVLIYTEGDEHLVFQEQPETVVMETAPCTCPADIIAVAGTVSRLTEKAIEAYEFKDDYDKSEDN